MRTRITIAIAVAIVAATVSVANAQAPTCTWTDNPIVAGQTPIKAQHLNEIRACMDAILANWPGGPLPPSHPPIQAYPSCDAMHSAGWTLGVNRNGGTYNAAWNDAEIQTYNMNTARDRDGDGHACEIDGEEPSGLNAGTWRVGTDVLPGRYFTSPTATCEWARRDAAGAAIDTIAGPNLVLSSMLQEIADIKASDHTFQTTCEPWQSTPTGSVPAGKIIAGTWLAGEQVTAGTYTTYADDGCYWATLSGFSGALAEIIDNEFVDFVDSVLNPIQRVTISASIGGFTTNDDCGTWTRVGDASGAVVESGDRSEIERNYRKRIQAER